SRIILGARLRILLCTGTSTTEVYTLSLHDALPISRGLLRRLPNPAVLGCMPDGERITAFPRAARSIGSKAAGTRESLCGSHRLRDRKSTRLNSSHVKISYAVFCLKKKRKLKTSEVL